MKSDEPTFDFKPFRDMKRLIESRSLTLPDRPDLPVSREPKTPENEPSNIPEDELFAKAMEGVTPVPPDLHVERPRRVEAVQSIREGEDSEVLLRLTHLVKYGTGFNVCDTPEYVEGTGYHVHPSIARRLHQGDFSIDAHLDLHGFLAEDAKEAFDRFLKTAVVTGKRGVLIVHGRGLSSPSEPVLKKKVMEWLTHGPWRKWVVAYASARACDGGAGATYVLLRQRPASNRFRRSGRLKVK